MRTHNACLESFASVSRRNFLELGIVEDLHGMAMQHGTVTLGAGKSGRRENGDATRHYDIGCRENWKERGGRLVMLTDQ